MRLKNETWKLRESAEDLELLQEVSKEISSRLEMKELLPTIMNAFVRAGKVKKGSLMIYNEETGRMEIKAAKEVSERAIEKIKLKIGEGIAGRVAETGEPLLINDTTKDKYYKEFFPEDPKGRPSETLLCLPLIFKDKVLGVITLDSKITGEQFIRNDERLLSILASQAAVSINNARMYKMAITDGLTKLYIQRYFLLRIEQEFGKSKRYGRPLSIIFVDIDYFKLFNDNYGHQIGDMALIHITKSIRKHTRATDICSRYGGDEFIIILPETPIRQGLMLGERLRKSVERNLLNVKGDKFLMTVSIGVAEYNNHMKAHQDLIREADRKLYQAKEGGRNMVMG